MSHPETYLEKRGVKPTANRLLVWKCLSASPHPISLSDAEEALQTMDKSSIFRVLTLFLEHHIVHAIEDGSGSLKYELCTSEGEHSIDDMHVHFHCESCRKTFCLPTTHIPAVELPEGFTAHSANYVVKGECPECKARHAKI